MTDTPDSDGSADGDDPAVDAAEVEHVAELARVRLEEGETAAFADQFAEILEYFEALDEVPDLDREEDLVNVMREDEIEEGLTREEALSNAAETEDGFFKGPKVS
ncbi:Asp-tRNA(Asn)/Glu-tRNA(Gln) amidotransferase subunit GatC [Halorubrum sp. F4]|uniref:Asp-tRNA(Asn)/Glu-tRNA(Gln) amidotransferase subunit GatC n=1 Tax=Halorubrum sp. F4 TaxID=2989715 RepID=UPI0024809AEB|nr:Asp-tRNA(Asn)/Glu-tRNA(Gln) amidotransferase subunit GatC [Halorubrum sp. F4]